MGFGRKIINIFTGKGHHPDDVKDVLIKLKQVSFNLANSGYNKRLFEEFGNLMYSFQEKFQGANKELVNDRVFKVIDIKTQQLVDAYAELDEKIPVDDENVTKKQFREEIDELNDAVNEIVLHFEQLLKIAKL